MNELTSPDNPIVRHMRKLGLDGAYRRETGQMLCEGDKLLAEALQSGVCPSVVLATGELPALPPETQLYRVTERLMKKVSTLVTPPQVVCACPVPDLTWRTAHNGIVLDRLQDPGNVGSVIRTAAAFGVDAVVLTPGCADVTGPKVNRATMGTIFRQKICELTQEEVFGLGLPLWRADLDPNGIPASSLSEGLVIIGNEGGGLSPGWKSLPAAYIPMRGRCESLGAAVAAAVVMWEMMKDS